MFVVNMLSAAWIKYSPYNSVSIASNVIMGLALAYLIQAHSRWAPYLTGSSHSRRDSTFTVSCCFVYLAGLNPLHTTALQVLPTATGRYPAAGAFS